MSPSYGPTPSPAATRERVAGHDCDELCIAAYGDPSECTCRCGGRNHGAERATVGPVTADVAARRGRDLDRLFARTADLDEAF